jgi:hypothetical protein
MKPAGVLVIKKWEYWKDATNGKNKNNGCLSKGIYEFI